MSSKFDKEFRTWQSHVHELRVVRGGPATIDAAAEAAADAIAFALEGTIFPVPGGRIECLGSVSAGTRVRSTPLA